MIHSLWSESTNTRLVGLLFDNFGPYHFARLRGAQLVLGPRTVVGLQIHAQSSDYAWRPAPEEMISADLQTIVTSGKKKAKPWEQGYYLWRHLDHLCPSVVAIAGYASPAMLAALAWCRRRNRLAVLISESKEDDSIRHAWKELVKSYILRGFPAAVVGGEPQRRYLEKLGFSPEAIFARADVVDNATYHPERIARLPRPLKQPYFLMVNRFVKKKNLFFALNCYAEYRLRLDEGHSAWHLVLAGDGPLRDGLNDRVRMLGLQDSVHFPGFLQQPQLLPYLAHCEVFLHASTTEQWGLVVNEAMAAGRPVFVSQRCGCYEDLVFEGRTGLGFDPSDREALISLLLQATRGELPLAALGAAALAHIDHFSPLAFGSALKEALAYGFRRLSVAPDT
jgi:1,2-diacylglycerol 3-alpha-glucosyltransferase